MSVGIGLATIRPGQRIVNIPGIGMRVSRRAVSAGSAANWWTVVGKTVLAAYKAKGAASLAASYVNLANPGTYDCTVDAFGPTLGASGWTFNGIFQHLNTNLTHTDAGQVWSALIAFSGVTNNGFIMGENTGSTVTGLQMAPNYTSNRRLYDNGKYLLIGSGAVTSGVMGIAGPTAYYNGVSDGAINTGTLTQVNNTIYIGRGSLYCAGNVAAVAIYSDTLSAGEMATVSAAMAAL